MKKNTGISLSFLCIFLCFIGCGGNDHLSSITPSSPSPSPIPSDPNNKPLPSSAFVVLYAWNPSDNEYQVLMGHDRFRNRDYWNLCGGKIDPNESPQVAACREVYEESVRWYGSDSSKNLNGKHSSFFARDLTDVLSFNKIYKDKNYTHYLYFKEVPYLDPQVITQSLSTETDTHFKENDDYGWLSWRTFAYHAIKEHFNHGHINRNINETMKGTHLTKTHCRSFTWYGFRKLSGANYALQITNKERSNQGLPAINSLNELDSYLTTYYPTR